MTSSSVSKQALPNFIQTACILPYSPPLLFVLQTMASRSAYNGPRRKLVLAFDVGATHSSISYSILERGQIPEIMGVTRFPAQEHIGGGPTIPTIIYYDSKGRVQVVGAEAMRDGINEQAEDEQWVKVELLKLHQHLRPRVGPRAGRELNNNDIPPLPLNKTVVEVFADFLAYLFQCASNYIQDTHTNGVALWASFKDQIDFVLSYSNGWEGPQQSEMRKAAVLACLIPDTTAGYTRLSIVAEGEAYMYFAVQNNLPGPGEAIKKGDGVLIIDVGERTTRISSYSRNTASNPMFEEMTAPHYLGHLHGFALVGIFARLFLERYLAGSPFFDDIEHIVRCFDKTMKLRFKNAEETQYVNFGSSGDNDVYYKIRFGQLKLLGTYVALIFKPSIDCIVKAVMNQKKIAHERISHVFLVGSFAASDYVFNEVRTALIPAGLNILRPENQINGAVSNGAISFYLDRFIPAQKPDKAEVLLAENQRLRDELKKAEGEIRALRATNNEADQTRTRELQRTRDELRTVDAENQALRLSNREIDQHRIRHRETATEMLNELMSMKKEQDLRAQSEIQGDGLVSAQDYGTKADLLSISDLCQKVSDLNDEIYSVAAWFGGAVVHAQRWMSEEVKLAAYQVACTMIGEPAAKIVVANASKTELDPIIIQLVMQIYLAKFCCTKIERWYEGGQETEDSLRMIYGEIKYNEEQAISGSWRGITRAYSRPSTDNWTNDFTARLQCIVRIASWEVTSPEVQNAFEKKLKPIFNAILAVRIAVGELFISADVEVFCPPGGARFDPQDMEDALFDGKRKQKDGGDGSDVDGGYTGSGGTIIGTAGLGLREAPRRGTHNSPIFLLPKVIL